MKKIISLFTILLFVFILSSCDKEKGEKEILEISTTSMDFGADASSQTVDLSSNLSYWSVSNSSGGWCEVSPSSGSGNSSIRVTVTKNNSRDSRYTTLDISGGSQSISLHIYQGGSTNTGGGELSIPTGVSANKNGSSISISWNAVSGATSYFVYRSNSSIMGTYSSLASVSSTSTIDASPMNGDNYYTVKASNGSIVSDFSASAYVNYTSGGGGTTKPNAPTGVTATQNGTSIYVSWNSVSGATGYKVYYSNSANSTYTQSPNSTSSTNGTDYDPYVGANYYKIKAFNSAGESDYSSYAYCNYSSGSGTTKPSAPTGVTVANEGNSMIPMITIRWNSVSNATSYKVYRSTSASGTYSQIESETANTVTTDNNPREGITYYKVKAINSAGESDYSTYSSIEYKANDVAPCPVTYGNCTVSGTTITIRWTTPKNTGCGTPMKAYLRVKNPNSNQYADLQTLSGTATSASFTYTPWVTPDGYVYVGIITENDKGTSGGIPKVYDTRGQRWIN